MMHGHEKSDLVIVAVKPTNKARKAPCGGVCGGGRSGVGGAKGGGQGEYAPAKHVLDSEPGSRVTGAGAYTAPCAVTHRGRRNYGAGGGGCGTFISIRTDGGCPVVQVNDLSRSLAAALRPFTCLTRIDFAPLSTLKLARRANTRRAVLALQNGRLTIVPSMALSNAPIALGSDRGGVLNF
jgi:hypothetical protein